MRAYAVGLIALLTGILAVAAPQQPGGDLPAAATAPSAIKSIFWGDYRRGWHFYEDPEPEAPPPKSPARPREAPAADPRPPELIEFARLQKRVEDYRNIAIIKPTEANVRRYMELEAKVVRQASLFSDVAQRVAWSTPELDMTLQGRPVNAQAIEVFEREQSLSRGQTLNALAGTHVLFFFFRSDCPYCHAFAPTLEAFQARHGIQIVPISVDGGGLPSFPQFRRDNGISRTLQVAQVPALYLAEPFTGKITPIGFGVLSESQLVERIATVAAPGAEAIAPSVTRRVSLDGSLRPSLP
jgi:conjugal transfer pilus assembly protein TraF